MPGILFFWILILRFGTWLDHCRNFRRNLQKVSCAELADHSCADWLYRCTGRRFDHFFEFEPKD